MQEEQNPTKRPTIEEVRKELIEWRQSKKKKGSQVPEGLWRSAVKLCEEYSFWYIAKELQLNYRKLKRLTELEEKSSHGREEIENRFVELEISGPMNPWECVMERERNKGGDRMRVYVCRGSVIDVVGIGKAMWGSKG